MTQLLRLLLGRTPLGWLQLARNRGRFSVAIAGVCFAVVLVFMQLGFMGALFETSVIVQRTLDADVVLVSPTARDLNDLGTVPRRRLFQAMEAPGVADGAPVYIYYEDWRNPQAPMLASLVVLGVDPDYKTFRSAAFNMQMSKLKLANAVLFDRASRGAYADVVARAASGRAVQTEMAGTTVTVAGLVRIGASFGTDGTLIVSSDTFTRLFPGRSLGVMTLGLLKAAPGVLPETLAARVRARLPENDTMVLTMDEFIAYEKSYQARVAPIGFVFIFGTVIGLIVGAVIVFQILSSDVADHLAEYATFKAMGFSDWFLAGIVVEESAILALFGFVPGFVVATALYAVVRRAITMPISMPASRVVMVLVLTFGMCLASSFLAMRRLRSADPADIF